MTLDDEFENGRPEVDKPNFDNADETMFVMKWTMTSYSKMTAETLPMRQRVHVTF